MNPFIIAIVFIFAGSQNNIGSAAADALSRAVVHAILAAESNGCIESYCDRFPDKCKSNSSPE